MSKQENKAPMFEATYFAKGHKRSLGRFFTKNEGEVALDQAGATKDRKVTRKKK